MQKATLPTPNTISLYSQIQRNSQSPELTSYIYCCRSFCHFFPFITLVIACRIIVPAFSVSFLFRPVVTHTLIPGAGDHSLTRSFSATPKAGGMALSRVISTPFARDSSTQSCKRCSWSFRDSFRSSTCCCFSVRITIGFSGEDEQRTHSLLGSSCARIARTH